MIAHIRDNGELQTVEAHNIETAKIAATHAKSVRLTSTSRLVSLLHDLGKLTQRFDIYIKSAAEDPCSVRRGEVNHSSAGGKYVHENYFDGDSYDKLAAQILSTAIFSHHGNMDCLTPDGMDQYSSRAFPQKEIFYDEALYNAKAFLSENQIDRLFHEAKGELLVIFEDLKQMAMQMSENQDLIGENFHFLIACLERFIQSLLIDADRTNTAEFMNGGPLVNELTKEGCLELWQRFQDRLDQQLQSFGQQKAKSKKQEEIQQLRNKMSEECFKFAPKPTGIYCLAIPTGGGKTLSALRFALEHAQIHKKTKIVYIAPYLSILEQNAKVIRELCKEDEYILEHHSNVVQESEQENEDENVQPDRYKILTQAWSSPVILTTMVQFLNTLFSGESQSIRRMHQLKDAVIILDEVQSIPLKCTHMFNAAMNFLSKCCNTTVVLCSATQPLFGRVERRILYNQPIDIIQNPMEYALGFKRVKIEDCTISGGYDCEKLVDFVLEKLNRNLLIVLNTKKAVKKFHDALKKHAPPGVCLVQLTTYMCPEHRSDKIKELRNCMKAQRVICISTQLIEAGVDISFENVIRSLAGLDNIVQAAGRCNRNGETDLQMVYIINFNEENLSSLIEIKKAGNVMQMLLKEYDHNPEYFQTDLLSEKSLHRYYDKYFWEQKGEMDYIEKDAGSTLFKLLSLNDVGRMAYSERNGKQTELVLGQAFAYTGRKFEVIGNQTIGLIVPYRDAKESIRKIQGSHDLKVVYQELKKLQRYTVNLYRDDQRYKELCKRGVIDNSLLEGRISILSEGFYSEDEGVTSEFQDEIS